MGIKGLRNIAIFTFLFSLVALLIGGYYAKDRVPPIPLKVVVPDGAVVMDKESILAGQAVYQSYGLMDHGSVWGHGTLRGMDFTATSLHRIVEAMRDFRAAGDRGVEGAYEKLPDEQRKIVAFRVIDELRANRYDPASGTLSLTPAQAYALQRHQAYWEEEFAAGDKSYGFLKDTVRTAEQRKHLADFFFWTAWAAGTQRPDADFTYTNNWPPDRAAGNTATPGAVMWSLGGLLALLIVLGIVVYVVHRYQFFFGPARGVEAAQRLLTAPLTPSQRSSAKFFLVAGLLFVAQIFNGGLLAHYTVHPASFFIKFIGETYPYSWAKSWHLQLGIFWIAISWIGTAVYVAPFIAGREPRGQRLLVNILFVAAVIVVLGSLLGEVLGIKGLLGRAWFWLGHQGWEYLELGRLWQILLYGGLLFWLLLVYRAIASAVRRPDFGEDHRSLIAFYVVSAVLLVGFFGFGLLYGPRTHLTIADMWRWFVVHIWVESIFEFFGVAVVSLFLVTLGLVTARSALRVAYLTASITFLSGIVGTAHHYFWFGGPSFWLAIGSVFSSLEPIPLILLVVRAWMEYSHTREAGREFPYRWPLYFLIASSFWNFLGAGVFGFLINLPIINYYEHATYLTPNHAHTALFGTYGMLAIALTLFSWRGLVEKKHWKDRVLAVSFWGLNIGLALMSLGTLLPVGLMQTWYSYTAGFWWARSAAFYELPVVQTLGNLRAISDTILIVVGAFPLLGFLLFTFRFLRKGHVGPAAASGAAQDDGSKA